MIEHVTLHSDGLRLSGWLHLPEHGAGPFPAAIVCHGLGSRAANHAEFAEFLAAHGWAALAFDFRGHGDSEGELDGRTVDDVGAAAAYLQTRPEIDGGRLVVRGSSMGGHYAIHAAAMLPELRAVVAVCPAPPDVLLAALRDPRNQEALRRGEVSFRMAPEWTRYLAGDDLVAAARAVAPRGLMLVHAKGDEAIDYRRTVALFEAAGQPKRLLLLEDGSHTSAQHDPAVHEEAIRWLQGVVGL